MSHLSLETLARLLDEAPDAAEAAHLESCDDCRDTFAAMGDDVHALGTLPDMAPAADGWAALERRLGDEGLIRVHRTAPAWSRFAQLAAAIVLLLAGAVTGRMTAAPAPLMTALDATSTPTDAGAATAAANAAIDVAPDAPTGAADDDVQADAPPAAPDRPRPSASTRLAASGFTGGQPRTMDEAAALLRETEQLYLTALTRYAEFATRSEAGDPVARLAALQSIVMTTEAALSQTPADPVINGVHLATLAQRDATLAQVAAATGSRWYE